MQYLFIFLLSILTSLPNSEYDHYTWADPEFLNRGAKPVREHTDRAEGEYDWVLTSTHIVKIVF